MTSLYLQSSPGPSRGGGGSWAGPSHFANRTSLNHPYRPAQPFSISTSPLYSSTFTFKYKPTIYPLPITPPHKFYIPQFFTFFNFQNTPILSTMTMKPEPYLLATTNWKVVQETDYTVAVLPWGATEAHNYHLPYGTDNYQAEYIAAEAARIAWSKGAKIAVLPVLPFGVNTGQLDIKLCMNLNPSTQLAILKDIVDVLARHNIHKMVIFNGHGGNHFKQMIRELFTHFPKVFVCSLNWYQAADQGKYFEDLGDHAGEMETSAMLHIAPDLVRPLEEAGDGAAKRFRIKAFNEGWATTPRAWTKVTKDTGVGNPYKGSAEKGAAYITETVEKISQFFVELHEADLTDMYE